MTPSQRRREGRYAFDSNVDPDEINPWLNLRKKYWNASSFANDFTEGWNEAKAHYEWKIKIRSHTLYAVLDDGILEIEECPIDGEVDAIILGGMTFIPRSEDGE